MGRLLLLVLIILHVTETQCYKILIYNPRLGHSHVNFFGRIADILVEAGHDVVTYMPELMSNVKTNGTKLARIIPGPHFDSPFSADTIIKTVWNETIEDFSKLFQLFDVISELQINSCSVQVSNDASMKQLREEHFDFGITELFSPCGYVVFHKIGLNNYASASATGLVEVLADPLGVSSNPSYVPALRGTCEDVMNYWERIQNLIAYMKEYLFSILLNMIFRNERVIKHLPNGFNFNVQEAVANSSFAFVNSEELLEFPRLVSHKIVYIGGVAADKPKPLSEEYQKIMNESVNGVVLVSFGSIAKSSHMPPHIKDSFREAFRSFPETTFLWKYEVDDNYAVDLPNVIKKKWVPQLDLLGHPNLRAFVSHCGQNSLEESVNGAVPLICIPLFADQPHNARVIVKRNIGIYINKYELSSETLKDAFRKILYDESYRKASQRLLEMIRYKPIPVRERLLRYIDFALKFGPIDNFNLASNNLSFAQYYLLDIIVPILLILALVHYFMLRMVLRFVCKLLSLTKLKTE